MTAQASVEAIAAGLADGFRIYCEAHGIPPEHRLPDPHPQAQSPLERYACIWLRSCERHMGLVLPRRAMIATDELMRDDIEARGSHE